MALQDRVIVLQGVKNGKTIIPKGTIGTIKEHIDGNTMIQYKYEDENLLYAIIPSNVLRKATLQDLEQVEDYRNLIAKQFHLGKKYAVSNILGDTANQRIGIIVSVDLTLNEQDDLFELAFEDGSVEQYPQSLLAYHSSFVEYDLDEFQSDLVKTNREVKDLEEKLYEEEIKKNGNR